MACSIEIYFGVDILTNSDGKLEPIQWMGYNSALRQYNGEIIAKREIQEKYRILLEKIETGQARIDDYDWTGMKKIFQSIFSAFTVSTKENTL